MAAASDKPAKTMSSRLMNMKFMKRTTATPSPKSSPANGNERSAKRQKLANGSPGTPSSVRSRPDGGDVSEEDQGAEEILRRQAELAGDTKWALSPEDVALPPAPAGLRVTTAGYGLIDSARQETSGSSDGDNEEDLKAQPLRPGRKSFGRFNKALERQERHKRVSNVNSDGSGDGEIDDEDDDESSEPGHRNNQRASTIKGGKRNGTGTQKAHVDSDRLRKLTSISSGGAATPSRSGLAAGQTCFNCGSPDHRKQDCPRPKRNNSKRK